MAKILIIDDDEQVRNLVHSYLILDHHEIATAENGKEGMEKLEGGQFDLIITDIFMPERDGLEVLISMINLANRPKIVVMTGGYASYNFSDLLQTAKLLNADKVLPKPVTYQTLKQAISELLQD